MVTMHIDTGKSKEAEKKRINKELGNIRSQFKSECMTTPTWGTLVWGPHPHGVHWFGDHTHLRYIGLGTTPTWDTLVWGPHPPGVHWFGDHTHLGYIGH